MTLVNGITLDGKFVHGIFEGKTEISSKGENSWSITVDEDGVVKTNDTSVVEYSTPPFFPVFQFQ